MADTNDQLRAKVNEAMIYAPSKWRSHVGRVVTAYTRAYETQEAVLKQIEARKRAETEFGTYLMSLVLPSVVGGFVGAMLAGQSKGMTDWLAEQARKFSWDTQAAKTMGTVALDTYKTVVADSLKANVRLGYQSLFASSGWRPSSMSPTEFMSRATGGIDEFVTAAADAMNESRVGRGRHKYRDVLTGLYYSPFIQDAPESGDLWDVAELAPVMEVFLWVDWANHRDTAYWLRRISNVTEPHSGGSWMERRQLQLLMDAKELKELNPILERFDACRVNRDYITQGMPALNGYRFLDLLWVRRLAPRYRQTLLGDLLERLALQSRVPVPIFRRPKSYRLM
jgi:hypothetical protein